MANSVNVKKEVKSPIPQGRDDGKGLKNKKSLKKGLLFGLMAFLTAFAIILVIFGGVFFIVIRNNMNGLADRYRKEINSIPVLRNALPKIADPEDPQYLTDSQLRQKYGGLRIIRDELQAKLDNSEKRVEELQKYKDSQELATAENEKAKEALREREKQLEAQEKSLKEDREQFTKRAAQSDRKGFMEFFEKVDPEAAARIYAGIVKEEEIDEQAREFAKVYEKMDPEAAAMIFEEMGSAKIDLVVLAIRNMSKDAASEVLAEMEPRFASMVTEELSKTYGINLPIARAEEN